MKRKDGVRRHWSYGRDVADAKALQIDGTTMLLDQDDSPRQLARGNLVVEEFGDALELVRRGRDIGGALAPPKIEEASNELRAQPAEEAKRIL